MLAANGRVDDRLAELGDARAEGPLLGLRRAASAASAASAVADLAQEGRGEAEAADEPVERVADLVAGHGEEVLLHLLLLQLGLSELLGGAAQAPLALLAHVPVRVEGGGVWWR